MTDKQTIAAALQGVTVGQTQTVGAMTMIPLLSDLEDMNFVAPDGNISLSSRTYGVMSFKNESEKTVIVPAHTAYITKQSTQDHAMTTAGVVPKKSSQTWENARCIEQTQGGNIRGREFEMQLLPFPLREFAFQDRKAKGMDRLWGKIGEFGERVGANTRGGHLKYFYDTYKDQLDTFISEFEYVDGQVGAIILVNGFVVGIERSPSQAYWRSVWKAVIRDCYGAIAIEMARNKVKPEHRFPIDSNVSSLSELRDALETAEKAEYDHAKNVVTQVISNEVTKVEEESTPIDVNLIYAENDQLVGQFIMSEGRAVYASFVVKEAWKKHRKWKEAAPFSM